MKRFLLSCATIALACVLAVPAHAQATRAVRKQVEATMLVTGTVDIAPDGRLVAHKLDQPEKLPGYAASLVERAVPALRFEPIEGETRPVRAKMTLRLVATSETDGDMRVAIGSAHFGEDQAEPGPGDLRAHTRGRMTYPPAAAEIGGKGIVYLLLRIGRDGTVQEAVAEQVNLTALGGARDMAAIRRSLTSAAIRDVTRGWRFAPPAEGESARRDYWVARLTVEYRFEDDPIAPYGQWSAYHPGERSPLPAWAAPTPPGFSPDALLAGEFAPEASRVRLVTPVGG